MHLKQCSIAWEKKQGVQLILIPGTLTDFLFQTQEPTVLYMGKVWESWGCEGDWNLKYNMTYQQNKNSVLLCISKGFVQEGLGTVHYPECKAQEVD